MEENHSNWTTILGEFFIFYLGISNSYQRQGLFKKPLEKRKSFVRATTIDNLYPSK